MVYNETVQIEGTTEHAVDDMLPVDSTNTEVVLESTTRVHKKMRLGMTTGTLTEYRHMVQLLTMIMWIMYVLHSKRPLI